MRCRLAVLQGAVCLLYVDILKLNLNFCACSMHRWSSKETYAGKERFRRKFGSEKSDSDSTLLLFNCHTLNILEDVVLCFFVYFDDSFFQLPIMPLLLTSCWMMNSSWRTRVQIAITTLSGNSLRQTAHTNCAFVHQAAKLVAAFFRVAGITAGLAESNGSLPPGLWLTSPAGWLPRTGISFGTIIEYGLPFLPLVPKGSASARHVGMYQFSKHIWRPTYPFLWL